MRKSMRLAILTALILVIAACTSTATEAPTNDPSTDVPPTLDTASISTFVAQTVEVEMTEFALANPTATISPPTATQRPSPTGPPANTQVPSATIAAEAADYEFTFIADVSIPDGTIIVGGETFTKTWRIQNSGKEPWTTEFSFVFVNGDRMDGFPVELAEEILPGGSVDVSIVMIGPPEAGFYTGFWMMSTEEDVVFGSGPEANQAVLIAIEIIEPTPLPTATNTQVPTPTNTPAP